MEIVHGSVIHACAKRPPSIRCGVEELQLIVAAILPTSHLIATVIASGSILVIAGTDAFKKPTTHIQHGAVAMGCTVVKIADLTPFGAMVNARGQLIMAIMHASRKPLMTIRQIAGASTCMIAANALLTTFGVTAIALGLTWLEATAEPGK